MLDGEIVELIKEDALTTEIEQPDDFKSEIYATLVRADHTHTPPTSCYQTENKSLV